MNTKDQRLEEFLRHKAEKLATKGPMKLGGRAVGGSPPLRAVVETMPRRSALEAIIAWYRPVLIIADDKFVRAEVNSEGDPQAVDPDEDMTAQLLTALEINRARLDGAIPSVGRIELTNNANYPWVGTGWLIASDINEGIIVTNAHVAREFGMKSGGRMIFRPGIPDFISSQSALIDFREELGGSAPREFPIPGILWISEDPSLDMALLRVSNKNGVDRIGPPIALSTTESLDPNRMLAVIGYPGVGGGYDPEPFRKVFGPVLGKKRFSPGLFDGMRNGFMTYDASTLPGSSGSVVLDVESGTALGLHFAGTAFDTNYAITAAILRRVLRAQPWRNEAATVRRPPMADSSSGSGAGVRLSGADVRIVVPLQITLQLGQPDRALTPSIVRTDKGAAERAADRVRMHLELEEAVLSVSAGYLFRDDEITDDFGVVVGVRPGASTDPSTYGLDTAVDGVTITVEVADPETIVTQEFGLIREAFSGRRAQYARDLNDERFRLSPVTDQMRIVLHVSPETGWPVLKEFLAQEEFNQFTVGMYHMTAPHIVQAIKDIAGRRGSRMTLSLDRQRGEAAKPDDTDGATKVNDIAERETLRELERIGGARFKWAPASLGAQGLFPSAYHIKVAVWDDRTFWLSSGNWQSSNQAPINARVEDVTWEDVADYNREWHAIVEHAGLAATFRNHLEQDYRDNAAAAGLEGAPSPSFDVLVPIQFLERPRRPPQFQAFKPLELNDRLKVQPLLTPDNYPEVIVGLISGARRRVLIQNQSFAIWKDPSTMPEHFVEILNAIKRQQKAGLDVRVIFRSIMGNQREVLRRMKEFGLKADARHVRHFDTCHTKGFVIDDDVVVLGSQNLTAAGTGPNRDASLVIWDKRANKYFADLFEYDWKISDNKPGATREMVESIRIVPSVAEAPTPPGFVRLSLSEVLGEV
ncbi:MAG: phospholipase D-like domain-containing protein [Planctomycetota bacterium]